MHLWKLLRCDGEPGVQQRGVIAGKMGMKSIVTEETVTKVA